MNVYQIRKFYESKEKADCPIKTRLVKSGYQQKSGGYIEYAHEKDVEVDYTKAKPSQWWHLIVSYCERTDLNKIFPKSIKCGELIFWMAEVAECVSIPELNQLADTIIKGTNDRITGNALIHCKCFDKIVEKVESTVPLNYN